MGGRVEEREEREEGWGEREGDRRDDCGKRGG
jgi:hypothetical protein